MSVKLPDTLRRITWKLPLSTAGLLLAVIATFSWTAYREVRSEAMHAASERLDEVSTQLAGLLEQAIRNRLAETAQLADDPVISAALLLAESDRSGAVEAMERLLSSSEQIEAIELWDVAGGRQLVAQHPSSRDGTPLESLPPFWAVADEVSLSGFRETNDVVWYEVAAPVGGEDGVLGYVVQRRRLSSSPVAMQMIAGLIGMDAAFLVGAPDGTWTDLNRLVAGPVSGTAGSEPVVEYRSPDRGWLVGANKPIASGPWVVRVEFPRDLVLGRSSEFLARILPLGLFLVLVGALGGLALSRLVTVDLARIRATASAIAQGDYSQRVDVRRPDELGELAAAFNTMVQRVEDSQHGLEDQIADRTLQLQLYASELEAANRELEAFSYSVSHDLRAPLRSMHGFSHALLEDYSDRLDEKGADYLNRVCAAADRMGQLIDDLIELSRATRTEMHCEDVDISELARRITTELHAAAPERRVTVEISDGLVANGDRRLLALLMQNLLENAWKFTSNKPEARIQVAGLEGEAGGYFVTDDGAGFDPAYADKLFGAFQRLHAASEFPGTGIGLALVQRIVNRHGGRVWAEGGIQTGATFYFTLSGS